MVKKRFFIGFNGILLALFLDICLLISIRTVDHHGHFQSATDKWETLLYILGLYFSFLLFEVIFYLIEGWIFVFRDSDIYVTIFLKRENL